MNHYKVYLPDKPEHAVTIAADTSWSARRIVAAVTPGRVAHDFVAIRQGESRRHRIKHCGDVIGYCFARTPESAIAAFREAHKIPSEIILTAERV